jgi:hypothetical protein
MSWWQRLLRRSKMEEPLEKGAVILVLLIVFAFRRLAKAAQTSTSVTLAP